MRASWRRVWGASAPLLVLIVLTLVFFFRLAFSDHILARGDTYTYFYSYWAARDAALSAGQLPLWTPHLFMGAPLLANSQLGTFYPPNWLTLGLPPPDAVRISILLHAACAGIGAALLARVTLRLAWLPALLAGAVYAFGGHVGAHVEQINQMQGLAWLPWLFVCFELSTAAGRVRRRFVLPLAMAWAMQLLAGHTQIAFISGVGLGVYGLAAAFLQRGSIERPAARKLIFAVRSVAILVAAAALAVLLALPQLVPTQELASLSNRGAGLNTQQAVAFSLNPLLIGRALLPSYDAQPFSEYVAYLGVLGLGLALMGLGARSADDDVKRRAFVVVAIVGLLLALGAYNPLYWPLATLPGFNLFRVPARWMALFALGMALLAGVGMQRVMQNSVRPRGVALAVGGVLLLMLASLTASRAAGEIDGPALPTLMTWLGWGVALMLLIAFTRLRAGRRAAPLLVIVCLLELWLAAQFLPHRDLSDPAVYADTRFPIDLLRVLSEDQTPPPRLLSISGGLFDPGDRARLETRWGQMGISARAARYAFTATKLQEVIAPNLPLAWGISSIDGYDGGLLPTLHYTAFSALLLPEGALRTLDGRLRENLARPICRGACLPEDRWLDLTGARYLLVDKVYDLVHAGIFYDTTFAAALQPGRPAAFANPQAFEADSVHVLAACDAPACDETLSVRVRQGEGSIRLAVAADAPVTLDGLRLLRFTTPQAITPDQVDLAVQSPLTIRAAALVDSRTGDFVPLAPPGWQRIYSAEVKIYENLDVLPRAFVVSEVQFFPDTWDGTEQALAAMHDPTFDPRRTAVLNGAPQGVNAAFSDVAVVGVEISRYTPTELILNITNPAPGLLVLTEAYYPGWQAVDQHGERLPMYRANVMFRGIPITADTTQVTLTYTPPMVGLIIGGLAWVGAMIAGVIGLIVRRPSVG